MCMFSTLSNSPVLCRHRLGLLPFNLMGTPTTRVGTNATGEGLSPTKTTLYSWCQVQIWASHASDWPAIKWGFNNVLEQLTGFRDSQRKELHRTRWERKNVPLSQHFSGPQPRSSLNLSLSGFVELPSHRHDWLNQWSLVINAICIPSLLPWGWGWGAKCPKPLFTGLVLLTTSSHRDAI